jgi:hypothetical protein
MKRKSAIHYRQGDILLIRISTLPPKAEKQPKTARIVLGEGETSGHRHEILEVDKVDVYRQAEGFYLSVYEETALVHPEHAPVALFPGIHERIRQVEYKRKELVRVMD